jgi:hypothetical protein
MEINNKVVYLLGAGASANSLPTDLGFVDALHQTSADLNNHYANNRTIKPNVQRFIAKIAEDMMWLAQEAKSFISVDGFAKYCFDKKQDPDFNAKFFRLKKTLSYFFSIEQALFKKVDARYKHFISKLSRTDAKGHHYFPSNVSILSWNYDFQVELASNIYRKEDFRNNDTYILPIINYWPQVGNHNSIRGNLNLIHLNGIAGFTVDHINNDFVEHQYFNLDNQTAQQFFSKLMNVHGGQSEMLHFAFERNENDYTKMLNLIDSMIWGANYLVVIGYSFGSVENSLLDKKIFDNIKHSGLRKIYVQDLENKAEIIRDKFQVHESIPIEHKTDCKTFFMPHHIFEGIAQPPPFMDIVTSKN